MIKAVKVKLYPTKQQEILMFKSCVSNIEKPFKNINKTDEAKRLNKKLKRLQKNFQENMKN